MRIRSLRGVHAAALVASIFAARCDDNSTPVAPGGVLPQIVSVSPNPIVAGSAPQTVVVSGNQFAASLRLIVTAPDGSSTTVQDAGIEDVQPTSFRARVVVDQPGTYTFVVENDNGARSEGFAVAVETSSTARPTIASITPGALPISTSTTLVAVTGQNFRDGLTIDVVAPSGATTTIPATAVAFRSSTRVEFTFAFDAAGIYTVLVRNPDGELSNGSSITVN